MILSEGDKLLVAHRRLLDGDVVRYFIGRVHRSPWLIGLLSVVLVSCTSARPLSFDSPA